MKSGVDATPLFIQDDLLKAIAQVTTAMERLRYFSSKLSSFIELFVLQLMKCNYFFYSRSSIKHFFHFL